MEIGNVCRLCLSQDLELLDIFATSDYELNFIEIAQLISPVEYEDQLSGNICCTCKDACNDFMRFRQTIQSSYRYQVNAIAGMQSIEYIVDDQLVEEEDEQQFIEEEALADETLHLDNSTSDIFASEDISLAETLEGTELVNAESDEEIIQDKDQLSCSKCNKSFSNEKKLLDHLKSHQCSKNLRLFPCKTCNRKFTSSILLELHEIVHSDLVTTLKQDTGHRCLVCGVAFSEKLILNDHLRDHKAQMETEDLSCLHCDRKFNKAPMKSILRHLRSHDENKTHLCNVCNKTFFMGQELVDHLNRHKGFLPHRCHICNKSYLQAAKLNVHLKSHAKDKEFLCTECGKSFNRNSNLRQHLLRHTGLKKFHCAQCPAKFVSKGNLTAHMSTHDAKKPFACQICGSSFTQSYSLVKHNRIHTGERPFQCEFCEMRFYSSDHLKRHIRTHTGEKPYKCEFCPKSFAQNGDLNKHKRLHIGGNTYKCSEPNCTEAFRLQSELRSHMSCHMTQQSIENKQISQNC